MEYRREVDGLRALAVVPVMLFHAGFAAFSGGFVGVDVFFVISGYLITSIIVADKEAGRFSLVKFYERRARRILPALFFVMAACLPFAWVLMDPYELKEFGQSLIATSFFLSNVYFFLKTGYFDTVAELKPLLHTWSLAVEEQYYVLFPLFMLLAWRAGRRWLSLVLALIGIASLALAHRGAYTAPMATFFLLPTRGWELAIGALIALNLERLREPGPRASELGSASGLVLILLAVFAFDEATPFPSLFALVPTIGTALIIIYATPRTYVGRLLGAPALVAIGLASYSAYLWHQPLLAFGRVYVLDALAPYQSAIALTAAVLLALLSKRYVEDYFRFTFLRGRGVLFLALCGAIAVAFAGLGYLAHKRLGFPERTPLNLMLAQNYGLSEKCSGAPFTEEACRTSPAPKVLLWGDSYAMHLGKAVRIASGDSLIQTTLSNCPPVLGYTEAKIRSSVTCDAFNERVYRELLDVPKKTITTVVMSSDFKFAETPAARAMFADTVKAVSQLGYKVVIVSPTPSNDQMLQCIKRAARKVSDYSSCDFPVRDIVNAEAFEAAAAGAGGAVFVDLRRAICADGLCKVKISDTMIFRDNGHLANDAAPYIAEKLRAAFVQ